MKELEIEGQHTLFWNVGTLRTLLKEYHDDTPIYVCGTAGVFIPNNKDQDILLDTQDRNWDTDEDSMYDTEMPNPGCLEYMDF